MLCGLQLRWTEDKLKFSIFRKKIGSGMMQLYDRKIVQKKPIVGSELNHDCKVPDER